MLLPAQTALKPDDLEQAYPSMQLISADIAVKRVGPSLWVYSFLHKMDNGSIYPANGIYFVYHKEGTLVDAGWDTKQAETLFKWAMSIQGVAQVVSTHFHADRTGGNAFFTGKGIPVYALPQTIQLASKEGKDSSHWRTLKLANGKASTDFGLEFLYPGPGHSLDNIVVYEPQSHTLYGGCLIKSRTATGLGNTADADVKSWPTSVKCVRRVFPGTKKVIPGHGKATADCLAWTLTLISKHNSQAN